VEFQLHPTTAALQAAGRQVYERMLAAMGDGFLKNASQAKATGVLTLLDRDGKESRYEFILFYKNPGTARFSFKSANVTYNVLLDERKTYRWDKTPPDAPALELMLVDVCRFQIPNVFKQLGLPQDQLTVAQLGPPSQLDSLTAEASLESYAIKLDPAAHIKEVKVSSEGLSNGLAALYGDYTGNPGRLYPRLMQVMRRNSGKAGISLEFNDLLYGTQNTPDEVFLYKVRKNGKVEFVTQF
jgi:hypothetical protein